jgi:hypothetical protein
MNGPIECIRCHAQMEAGYVADLTHAGYQQENWSPGEPKPAFWVGLKVKTDQFVPVTRFVVRTAGIWNRTQSSRPFPTNSRRRLQFRELSSFLKGF